MTVTEEIEEKIHHLFDSSLRENDDCEQLNSRIAELLHKKGFSLSAAESCTGGLISSYLTDISGSSAYFKGSVIAYSNEVKTSLLGVRKTTIAELGAVSPETAGEMAKGICKLLKTDIGLSSTGIAGPTGASPGKSVGTVYIALAAAELVIVKKLFFPDQSRKKIKNLAAQKALKLLHCCLIVSD